MNMLGSSALETVQAWQEALNLEDKERVLQLSDPDIEIVGPRGSAFGIETLWRWLESTRVQLLPKRAFAEGETIVVEQTGIWRDPVTGETIGEAEVASVFRVLNGRVAYYARFDQLESALRHAGVQRA